MNKITTFTAENIEAIRKESNAALAQIAAKYGIEGLRVGNLKYSTSEVTVSAMKLKLADKTAVIDKYESLSKLLGYTGNILGKKVYSEKYGQCEIVDINLSKPKYSIVTRTVDGKTVGFAKGIAISGVDFIGERFQRTISRGRFRF